jgi:hypothetical protein
VLDSYVFVDDVHSMHLHIAPEPLTYQNFSDAIALWPDRPGYTAGEFDAAMNAAGSLVRQRRAFGALIRAGRHTCGFGMTVFVKQSFTDDYFRSPHPQLGKRVLLVALDAGSPVLSLPEIASGNTNEGLQLLVVATNIDPMFKDRSSVLGHIVGSFLDTHAGYRIVRVLNEVFGDCVEDVRMSGVYDIQTEWDRLANGVCLKGVVGTLTRDQASEQRNPLLPIFLYNPPRIRFNATEQELLRTALDGDPDDELARRLGISLSAVKARWTRIQQRATENMPELFAGVPQGIRHNRRGAQVRHLIVRYVRSNRSELTPYMGRSEGRVTSPARSGPARAGAR